MTAFLSKIYTYQFFDELILIYPLYAVMFADYGLTAIQIGVLFAVWAATALILEVPSGVLADKYSRRHILFFAALIRILGYALWLFSPTFAGFLAGFICWGITSAFTSGTFEALVFDELKRFGCENEYTKVIGRAKSLGLLAVLIASVGASALESHGYPFLLYFSMVPLLLSGIAAILLPKAVIYESTGEREYIPLLKRGLADIVRNASVLRLILFISFSLAVAGSLDEFWPLFGNQAGLPNSTVAVFFGSLYGFQAIGSAIAHKFRESRNAVFYSLFIINGALLLIASLIFKPYSVIFLLPFVFLFQIFDVILEGRLQHAIPTGTRATVSSVKDFVSGVSSMGVLLAFGAIAGAWSYQKAFIVSGIVIIFTGLFYLLASFVGRKN